MNIMARRCLACGQPAITLPDWPALCGSCIDRTSDEIEAGASVVCNTDERCSGVVDRLEDDLAVVTTANGAEAWVPVCDLVRVADC